jgi:hypothetical protein
LEDASKSFWICIRDQANKRQTRYILIDFPKRIQRRSCLCKAELGAGERKKTEDLLYKPPCNTTLSVYGSGEEVLAWGKFRAEEESKTEKKEKK